MFDDSLIVSTLAGGDPKWADYEMPLPSEDPQLWAIGVRLDDLDGSVGKLLKEMSAEWHKNGKLLELETKWGIKQSPYLVETNKKFKAGGYRDSLQVAVCVEDHCVPNAVNIF